MRYGLSYFRINRHGKPSSCPPCAQVCAPGRAYFDIYSNRRNVVYLRYQGTISTPTTIRKNVQFKFRSRKLFHSFLLPRPFPKMFGDTWPMARFDHHLQPFRLTIGNVDRQAVRLGGFERSAVHVNWPHTVVTPICISCSPNNESGRRAGHALCYSHE